MKKKSEDMNSELENRTVPLSMIKGTDNDQLQGILEMSIDV